MFLKSKILYFSIITLLFLTYFSALGQQLTVTVDNNGIAKATITPLSCTSQQGGGGVAILYWGDLNQNNSPCPTPAPSPNQNPIVLYHQYQACGTYTVTYTCEGIPNPPILTATVTVTIPTLVITHSPVEYEQTDCGRVAILSMLISRDPSCGPIPGNINISSAIHSDLVPIGGAFEINGNSISLNIPGSSITTTPVAYTLELRSKICSQNTSNKITYDITGPLGVGLGIQNCISLEAPPTQSSTKLEWLNIVTRAPCLQINKTTLTPSIPSGGDAQFQVTVTNTGTANAANVQVTDVIPPNFTVVSSPVNSTVAGSVITTTVPLLIQGLSWTGTYTLRHVPPVPPNPCAPVAIFTNCAQAGLPNCEGYTTAKSCSEVQVVTAVLPPNPNFTVNEVDCNSFQFVSEDTGQGTTTHSWNFGDGTTSIDFNPYHDFANNGTFIVSHSISRCGQMTTQTQIITVNCPDQLTCPCSGIGSLNINAGAGTNITDIPELASGGVNLDDFGNCIAINGKLIINTDVTISDGTVNPDIVSGLIRMQPGAIILVQSDKNLTITGTDIVGCDNMWQMIKVGPSAKLILRNNNISDAEFAVDASALIAPFGSGTPTELYIEGNNFKNNHVGIRITGSKFLKHYVNGNSFSSLTTPLLTSWTPNLPNYNNISGYAGIVALNKTFSSSNNVFTRVRNGIISEVCNITSREDKFNNILGTPAIFPSFTGGSSGIGILAIRGKLASLGNSYQNLHTGIFTDDNPLIVNLNGLKSNTFNFIDRAIFANRTHSANIAYCEVENFRVSGITINQIIPNGEPFFIHRNFLTSSGTNAAQNDNEWAISVNNPIEISLENGYIGSSIINIRDNTGGIRLSNVRGWTVGPYNQHSYTGGANLNMNVPGFRFENGGSHFIYENETRGNQNNDGYQTLTSGDNIFCCNDATLANAGFFFSGTCLDTEFRNNKMSATDMCLRFTDMTRISKQPDRANRFLSGSGKAVHESNNFDIAQCAFFINDINNNNLSDTGDQPWFPTLGATQGLFNPTLENFNDNECWEDPVCWNPFGYRPVILDDQDHFAAAPNSDNSIRATTQHWESQRHLYQKLRTYPALLGQSGVCDQFFSDQYTGLGDVGKYTVIESRIGELRMIPAVWASHLQLIEIELANIQTKVDSKLAELTHATNFEDSIKIYYDANNIGQDKVSWLNESDSLAQLFRTYQRNEALLLIPVINNLPEVHVAMTNRKLTLMAYARYIAEGSPELNSAAAQEIANIALQCPLEGGSAVYLARGLYAAFGSEQVYDDLSTCGVQSRSVLTKSDIGLQVEHLHIIPNPAQNRCALYWETPTFVEGKIRIWATDGRLMLEKVVTDKSIGLEIQTMGFANGLYYCQYSDNSGQVLTSLLSIQN